MFSNLYKSIKFVVYFWSLLFKLHTHEEREHAVAVFGVMFWRSKRHAWPALGVAAGIVVTGWTVHFYQLFKVSPSLNRNKATVDVTTKICCALLVVCCS